MRKIFEMVISNDDNKINAISIVDRPANESVAIKMQRQETIKMQADEDKQTLTGVVLIPEQLIYRNINNQEFDIYFSENTISELAQLHLSSANQNSITLDHLTDVDNNEVTVIESWLVADPKNDKANAIGLGEQPKGTWLITMKVNDSDIWQRVKDNELNGFSIESLMGVVEHTELSVIENILSSDVSDEDKLTELRKLILA